MKRWTIVTLLLLLFATPAVAQTTGIWTSHTGTGFEAWASTSGLRTLHDQCGASSSVGAIINAWNTMALHEQRGELLNVRGGGHADSCFNGGIAFRFATKSWHLLTTPSPQELKDAAGVITRPGYVKMTSAAPDDTFFLNPYSNVATLPSSVHVYGATATITTGVKAGQIATMGGIYWSRAGKSAPAHSWLYDPTKTTAATAYTRIGTRPGGYGTAIAWNPVTHRMMIRMSSGFALYDPAANTYQTLFSLAMNGSSSALALNEDGTNVYAWDGGLKKVHLPTAATTKQQAVPVTGPVVSAAYGMGLVYDNGQLFLLAKGPTTAAGALYSIQVEKCGGSGQPVCNEVKLLTPGALPTPVPSANGTWGRFAKYGCDLWLVQDGVKPVSSFRPAAPLSTCAAPLVTLTLTSTGSTGAGTISGAGSYAVGATATVSATPQPGSIVGGVTGDAGCQIGPVTMNANKTCNIPLLDVQAPTISISSPTENQIIKTATPLTYTVSDNMPGAQATVLLDGQPFAEPMLDPALLTEGVHQFVIRGGDAAGNITSVAVNVVSVKCPVCQIPTAAIVTVVKAGNGTGTVTGAGAYAVGAPVSIVATADAGSTLAGMSPPLCAQHPTFPMPSSDLTCTVTFDKVIAQYQLNITQAGSGHGSVTGAGTYPDGTVVPISGTPTADSTGPVWSGDPDCADGSVVMTATRLCIATFTLIPPPDPTLRTVSTVMTGPGTGTVSGSGQYAVGAPVTLTVTPAASSVIAGITPVLCSSWPFVMPSTDVTCTITFGLPSPNPPVAAPVTGGPAVNLPIRTWAHMPMGVLGQSKHARLAYDSKRKTMALAGGDGTDGSGNSYTGQNVFSINLAVSNAWTKLHGSCPAPGGVMPARPDNVTWVYDSKRDLATVMPAYYGGAATCAGVVNDTLKRPYNFNFDTKQWILSVLPTPANGWGGDLHNHYGVYDPVTDATYRFFNGCGMQIIPMDASPGVCLTTVFPNAPPGSWDQSNDSVAIDVQGRMIYGINRYKRVLVKWSIVERKVVELIPLPATWVKPVSEFGGGDYETYMAFDSKNRVLFLPNAISYGGLLINTTTHVNRGLHFFNVDTKVWEWEAAPVDNSVSGNVLGYDAANNVFLFVGRSVTKRMWLYRYK